MAEAFMTFRTQEWFFSSVDSPMLNDTEFRIDALLAFRTLIRFFLSVLFLLLSDTGLITKVVRKSVHLKGFFPELMSSHSDEPEGWTSLHIKNSNEVIYFVFNSFI